jgi:hypothetical protein
MHGSGVKLLETKSLFLNPALETGLLGRRMGHSLRILRSGGFKPTTTENEQSTLTRRLNSRISAGNLHCRTRHVAGIFGGQ